MCRHFERGDKMGIQALINTINSQLIKQNHSYLYFSLLGKRIIFYKHLLCSAKIHYRKKKTTDTMLSAYVFSVIELMNYARE